MNVKAEPARRDHSRDHGCARSSQLNLATRLQEGEVDCGNGAFVVADVGETVDCTLELGRQRKPFKVTVKSKTGTVSIST